ncbi:MAG: helix-turn-helix transcriptional regulator [Bacillota bacterium]|jgi:transcriptional regulator with XRE-family HTH domain|nr:helix-turn-helix transcriptional regulator [Bacillota bacterium]
MSYSLGSRIKELRTNHKISQEQMAEALGTTRQRYSRIENGQVDISFVMIKKIADYLGVPTHDITIVEEQKKDLVTFFREKSSSSNIEDCVERIENILKVFHAHEKLYYQMKVRDGDVD